MRSLSSLVRRFNFARLQDKSTREPSATYFRLAYFGTRLEPGAVLIQEFLLIDVLSVQRQDELDVQTHS